MEARNLFRLFICITPYFHCLRGYLANCTGADVLEIPVKVNQIANLPCRLPMGSHMDVNVRWFSEKDGWLTSGVVVYKHKLQIRVNKPAPNEWNLRIIKVTVAFEDTYTCKTEQGIVIRTVKLIIQTAVQTTIRSTTPNCTMKTRSDITITAAVQTTIRSTTSNSSMKITSEVASTSAEQVDHNTVLITVAVAISVAISVSISVSISVVIIFCLGRKRRTQGNSYGNRQRATMANSDDFVNASLPTNLQHHTVATDDDYSNASIPDTHTDHRVTDVDNHYLNESLQSNLSIPVAANTASNYANDLLHGISIISTADHEYLDINYEELLSQREDSHCYGQLKT